jgi:hypothetical protein
LHLVEEKLELLLDDQMVVIDENEVILFLRLQKMKIHFYHIDIKRFLRQKDESLVEPKINMEQMVKILY